MARQEVHVGVVLALAPKADEHAARALLGAVLEVAHREMEEASGAQWRFDEADVVRLENDSPRRPSDFMDDASLHMVEGPYDVVLVVTDVGLISRRQALRAGLYSRVARVAVLSTRKLTVTPRGRPMRALDAPEVRANATWLVLHMLGHILGLSHRRASGTVMSPFRFDDDLDETPRFAEADRARLPSLSARMPDKEAVEAGAFHRALFHVSSALRHPKLALLPVLRSRAPLLSLRLPSLATAAVVPTFILIFTAEIWDVGLNLDERVAWTFAAASLLAATAYVLKVQNLFFPHKEKRLVTEHIAVVNASVALGILMMMLGLFVMVGLLMLVIELYVFPEGLITTWPTLEDPEVTLRDRVVLAGFVSTIALLTGALAGGIEKRTVVRHLALFADEP